MATEAQQRASLAYRTRQLEIDPKGFRERQLGYAKKSFRIYYALNAEYRLNQIRRSSERYYYNNSNDQFLKSIRNLFK